MDIARGIGDFLTLKRNFHTLRGQDLRDWQRSRCNELVRFAVSASPLYRRLYAGRDLENFEELPTIDKAVATEGFDDLNTAGLHRSEVEAFALGMEASGDQLRYLRGPDGRDFVIGMSSGTSGSRGLVVTERAISEGLPFVFAARSGLPIRLLPWRIVFMLRVFSKAFQDINAPLIRLDYVNTMTPVQAILDKVGRMRAKILMAPPSMLRILADHAPSMPSLRLLVSYAEVLEEADEAAIRWAFDLPLIQIYQASEGPIGCACRLGSLHINEDLVYVELLDGEGRPVTEPGQKARRMLVTNLYNRVQPLIRYELNDLVELGEPCPCGSGFRTIRRVIGRADDVLWFASGEGGRQYVFPDLVSRWIISASGLVSDYAIAQAGDDSLELRLSVTRDEAQAKALADVLAALRAGLERHGCLVPAIRFAGPVELPPPGMKRKRFVSIARKGT
jgi:putative adenylate-forming enzyme